jgi:squalene-associated FAD-dependent desaturase
LPQPPERSSWGQPEAVADEYRIDRDDEARQTERRFMPAPPSPLQQRPSAVRPRVVIVGGGLAGLAAAAALADSGAAVTLCESRRRCGGRAASFDDPAAGGLVDACQHVAMGCCTNFLDLCRRAGLADGLRCDRTLTFIGPDNLRADCTPARWLPPPLHLLPMLAGMRHFGLAEKLNLSSGMIRLARLPTGSADETALRWLRSVGQRESVIRLFWQPVLESALGESIDLVRVGAARKVVVDGFLAHRQAADLWVPTEPLGVLFGRRLVAWLEDRGVEILTGNAVTALVPSSAGPLAGVELAGATLPCAAVVLAIPWRAAGRLVPELVPGDDPRLAGSPITAVHLWFDRPAVDLPHAVLVGRVSQWVFRPEGADTPAGYCQVVISASRGLMAGDRSRLIDTVVSELREAFPSAGEARLLEAKVVTDPTAVLSVRPGVEEVRPSFRTVVPNLFLAGDWTATGWPSTMEGAVRSGRLAAAAAAQALGLRSAGLVGDLSRSGMVRWLAGDG